MRRRIASQHNGREWLCADQGEVSRSPSFAPSMMWVQWVCSSSNVVHNASREEGDRQIKRIVSGHLLAEQHNQKPTRLSAAGYRRAVQSAP